MTQTDPSSSSLPPSPSVPTARGWRLFDAPLGASVLLCLLTVLLLVPGLSRDGLWDPQEIKLLELTSTAMSEAQRADVPPPKIWQPVAGYKPRVLIWPIVQGVRAFGLTELGGRLPMLGLAALLLGAVFALGALQRRVRAALLSSLVLLLSPVLFLSARLLSTTLLPLLSQTLFVLGLFLATQPTHGSPSALGKRLAGLFLALFAAPIAVLSSGVWVGLLAPLLAVLLAHAVSDLARGPLPASSPDDRLVSFVRYLCALAAAVAAVLPLRFLVLLAEVPTWVRLPLAAAGCLAALAGLRGPTRAFRPLLIALLASSVLLSLPLPSEKFVGFLPWLAGPLHWPGNREVQIDSLVKQLGFSLFPWVAFLPLGLVARFANLDPSVPAAPLDAPPGEPCVAPDQPPLTPDRFAGVLWAAWLAFGYLFSTLHAALVGEQAMACLAAAALLIGGYLDELLTASSRRQRTAALCVALFVAMIGRDLAATPELLMVAHLGDLVRWPAPLAHLTRWLALGSLGLAGLWALAVFLHGVWRRRLVALACVAALGLSGGVIQGIIPALSKHLSYRGLYTRYQKLGGGKLGLYSIQQASGKIYGQHGVQLGSLQDLIAFLDERTAARAFAIVSATELGAIDREAHLRGMPYFVVDDSNAQFVLLSNRLLPSESDLNPLRRFVLHERPVPQFPLSATFEDKVELIGIDAPAEVARGQELVLRFYFRVLQPLGINYRVFVHLDGSGTRVNGDHMPVAGKFQTAFWSPGTYIVDEHRMTIQRMSSPPGYYQVFTGLWPGGDGQRLQVTSGPHEADHRVRVGAVRIK